VAEVYFSPRLATERHRVIEQVDPDEAVIDMFAGVGPYAVPMDGRPRRRGGRVRPQLNERAVEYLRENAERNGVADRVTAIAGDVRGIADAYADTADRLVMNLPHSADEFLETAVRLAGDDCAIHYYDIQHEDDPFGPGRRAIEAAAGRRVRRGRRRDRACRQILRPARVQRLSGCAADPSMTSVYSRTLRPPLVAGRSGGA